MTPAHRTPRIDITGPCLLLAETSLPGVDVVLIDLADASAAEVADMVAEAETSHASGVGAIGGKPSAVGAALEAGVGLVVLDALITDPVEIRAAVESGVVVVLHHEDPSVAVGAVDMLTAAGIDTGRVVVEVGPVARPGAESADEPHHISLIDEVTVLERSAFGFRVGAVVGPAPDVDAWADAQIDGWEIGTLTALLGTGVACVRGVDPERFRRVVAVLAAVDGAL